jgi:hypothetical protein
MSIDSVSYADFDVPPPDLMQAVDDGLDRYNQESAPLGDVRPLGSFASDAGGRVIGGAVGRTWGGCTVFYLTTLSLQGPGFYRKHSYAARGEIRGYPDDIAKFLMVKELPCR